MAIIQKSKSVLGYNDTEADPHSLICSNRENVTNLCILKSANLTSNLEYKIPESSNFKIVGENCSIACNYPCQKIWFNNLSNKNNINSVVDINLFKTKLSALQIIFDLQANSTIFLVESKISASTQKLGGRGWLKYNKYNLSMDYTGDRISAYGTAYLNSNVWKSAYNDTELSDTRYFGTGCDGLVLNETQKAQIFKKNAYALGGGQIYINTREIIFKDSLSAIEANGFFDDGQDLDYQ